LRIVVVHNRYRSVAPSGENRVVDRERAALVAAGHEVEWFERDSDDIEGWPVARRATLPGRMIWSRESYRGLRAVLAERRPDVVHVHNTFPLLSASVLYACRAAGVPVVTTLHNYRLMCAPGSFFRSGAVCHDCVTGPAIQAVVHACYRDSRSATASLVAANIVHRQAWRSLVSAYVFISAAQRDLLAGLDLPPERVFVRHNLIPRRVAAGDGAATRDDYVLYAARLDEAKGVRLLMAGWDAYLSTSGAARLRLVIAGAGELEREVAGWASARPSVQLVGHADEARCARLMSRARAVVLPSAWEEPFGLVAVEAMAAGAPPMAAAHGAFTELITPGVDGVLFTAGDPAALGAALGDLVANPDRYQAYGVQARETYQKRFDPERNIEQLIEIYRYAMANPRVA